MRLFDSERTFKNPEKTNAPSNAERTKASSGAIAARALESSAKNIARGAKAVRKVRPDASDYSAEFESLVGIAGRNSGFCLESLFQRQCDTCGHEHEVWFAERDGGRVLKATHPNKCGLTIGKDRNALPTQYFRRLALQCRVFGDDIRYECLWNSPKGLRIVTSQPAIRGRTATQVEMEALFTSLGFIPLTVDSCELWYRQSDQTLAFDAHTRNFVVTSDDVVVPIDLNMVTVMGSVRRRLDIAIRTRNQLELLY